MKLVTQLKEMTLAARKERSDAIKISLLVTLSGEVAKKAKDEGNREQTDADVEEVVRKFVKGANEMTKYGNAEQKAVAGRELEILAEFLPKQLTKEQLESIMRAVIAETGKADLGTMMKHLKANYAGLYDGAQAKAVFEALVTFNP